VPPIKLKFGPADHGRPVTADELEDAEYTSGFKYEIINGSLYVSPEATFAENRLENWLRDRLLAYSWTRPDVLNYLASKGRVFLPTRVRATVPEPDLAAYANVPLHLPAREVNWEDISPMLVVEVLVDGDIHKDLTRNPALYLRVPSIQEYWVVNGAVDPDRPSLICHRRSRRKWVVSVHEYGSLFVPPLLPGFELLIDPRR
jgi:Uma2 family endonuclease